VASVTWPSFYRRWCAWGLSGHALIAADLDLAADVGLHLAPQVAFHLQGAFDVVTQLGELIVAQILRAHIPVDAGRVQNLL
jgi:hypothetical protein